MAGRIRTEKPEEYEDERIAGLSSDAFRLRCGKRSLADDHGNGRASPGMLHGHVFHSCPISNGRTIDDLEEELVKAGLVMLYTVNGQRYFHLVGWEKDQRVTNAGEPRVPPPPGWKIEHEIIGKGK